MMAACKSGDVPRLQQLLSATGVHHGKLEREQTSGLPEPLPMIMTAVEQKQSAVVSLLLDTYPRVSVEHTSLLDLAFANPDLATFKLLFAKSPGIPGIVDFEFEHLHTTSLMEACRSGNPVLPDFLLDHGADPEEGGFPGMGPLYYAVLFSQPIELIAKMIEQGAVVRSAVMREAIRKERPELLSFFFRHCWLKSPDEALSYAHTHEDKTMIVLVEDLLEERRKNGYRRTSKMTCTRTGRGGGIIGKGWWPFWK